MSPAAAARYPWEQCALADTCQIRNHAELALFLGGSEDSFTGVLLYLIAKASATPSNLVRLTAGFGYHVLAWQVWQSTEPAPTVAQLRARLEVALASTQRPYLTFTEFVRGELRPRPAVRGGGAYTLHDMEAAWNAGSIAGYPASTGLAAAAMGCDGCEQCANCPHTAKWHPATGAEACLADVVSYVDRPTGPPWPVTVPCTCTGYQPRGEQVSTPQAGDQPAQAQAGNLEQAIADVDQAAAARGTNLAADTAAAAAVIHEANAAYSALHQAFHVAHQAYLDAVKKAHTDYATVMIKLHHQVTTPPPPASKPGEQ